MKTKSRTLKVWNGRGHGKLDRKHISVAAYSKKQAAELVSEACNTCVSVSEITVYYAPCWGNDMNGINPVEPCVYVTERFKKNEPVKVIPNI